MSRKITFGLSVSSVRQAQKQLADYKNSLQRRCREFVKRLSEQGIDVAKVNLHSEYKSFIAFTTELDPIEDGYRALMIATNTGLVRRQWRTNNNATGIETADVSPLMMSEFGSGAKADNARGAQFGMGTGTFPGQKHANDPGGWYWQDLNYEWHQSDGEEPTMPMYHAYDAMLNAIVRTAKEVFGA